MPLPDVKWTPLSIPNPNRKWWQFWKPRTIINSDALMAIFDESSELFDGIVWREVEELR